MRFFWFKWSLFGSKGVIWICLNGARWIERNFGEFKGSFFGFKNERDSDTFLVSEESLELLDVVKVVVLPDIGCDHHSENKADGIDQKIEKEALIS